MISAHDPSEVTSPVVGNKLAWGYCWSPLVDGDNVILTPGGKSGLFAALNKKGQHDRLAK